MAITERQKRVLESAIVNPLGLVTSIYGTYNGLGSASRRRMMSRLCLVGLVRPYVHGGYEITAAGREALTQQLKQET